MTTATQVYSATLVHGEVHVFTRTAAPGTPGTVTAADAATMTDRDWARLARQRKAALRTRQRNAGMHRPMPPRDAVAEHRQATAYAAANRLVPISATEIRVLMQVQTVGTWRHQHVPTQGLMWCWFPAGHARMTGFQAHRPSFGD